MPAPDPLRAILDAPEDAHRAREAAYQAQRAAQEAAYTAERAHKDAAQASALRGAILRALYHLPDAEPYEPEPEPYGSRRFEHRYQTHRAHASAYTVLQYGAGSPKAHAVGWTNDTTTTLYESPRGTNDPAKLAAELARADDAARAWIETQTARAFLAAHEIDPDAAPPVADLVAVETIAATRTDSWNGRYTVGPRVEYALRLGAEIIATCPAWDATDDRDTRDARSTAEPETTHAYDPNGTDRPDPAQLAADNETAAAYWRQWEADALPALLAKLR